MERSLASELLFGFIDVQKSNGRFPPGEEKILGRRSAKGVLPLNRKFFA
jgi:hypothetical protein